MSQANNRALALTLVILTIVFGLIVYSCSGPSAVEQRRDEIQIYADIPFDPTLIKLDKQTLDEAYKRHLIRLFDVWLSGDIKQMERMSAGLKKVRAAYNLAAGQIAKREQMENQQ